MQKFHKGDLVKIAKENVYICSNCLTPYLQAIVIGSYKDQYGGSDTDSIQYTLFIKDYGRISWFYETLLTLIEKNRIDLLEKWEFDKNEEVKTKSNLDWIFENSEEVIKNPMGCSIESLANCLGLTNLWGSKGEGITYYINAQMTLLIAKPFLEKKDKEGWLEYCEKIKKEKNK